MGIFEAWETIAMLMGLSTVEFVPVGGYFMIHELAKHKAPTGSTSNIDIHGVAGHMRVVWKAENKNIHGELQDEVVNVVEWNSSSGVATGCYESAPHMCGHMYKFWVACTDWTTLAKLDGDGYGIAEHHTPGGKLTGVTPSGTRIEDGEWMLVVDEKQDDRCSRYWLKEACHNPNITSQIPAPTYTPYNAPVYVNGTPSAYPTPTPSGEPEPCKWATGRFPKREVSPLLSLSVADFNSFFAALPTDNATVHDVLADGAALVHKHLAAHDEQDHTHQARVLHAAVAAIMNRPRKHTRDIATALREPAVSDTGSLHSALSNREPVDEQIKTLHHHILEKTPKPRQKSMEVLAMGAVARTVVDRLETMQADIEDLKLIRWMFNRVHGPSKVMLERKRLLDAGLPLNLTSIQEAAANEVTLANHSGEPK